MLGCAVCIAFLLCFTLHAQSPDSSAVRGSAEDAAGSAVAGAAVTLRNRATGAERTTRTDNGGRYMLPDIPLTGEYDLSIDAPGFAEATRRLRLRAGEAVTADVVLRPESQRSEVTVYGSVEGVRSDSPELGRALDNAQILNTPVLGGKITNLPLLDSAVRPARGVGDLFVNSTLFVINGGGRRQNGYTLDGASADDSWGRQTIFTAVPLAAVQEVAVLTNSFSAEYGRNAGGMISVNTRSGGNQFHGDLLGVFRPAGIEARAPLSLRRTADQLGQWSGAISGPVARDRLQFLLSAEQSWQDRDSTVTSPLEPGNYRGQFRQSLLLARIDGRLGAAHTLTGRVNFDRFHDTNPADAVGGLNLPGAARVYERKTYAGQAVETAVLGAYAVNAARVSYQSGSPITRFQPVMPSTQLVVPGVATSGESRSAWLTNHQWQFADTLSLLRGRHSVKIGVDSVRAASGGDGTEFGSAYVLGQFTFRSGLTKPLDTLTLADAQRYQQSFGNTTYRVTDWLAAGFVQDNVRVLPSLSLDLGLRYDRQTFSDGTLDFAPRAGFAWNPASDARTVVRGGYGLFYSQLRDNLAASFQINGPEGLFTFSAAPGQLGFPTSLAPIAAFPAGAVLPARDITVRPGQADYLSRFLNVSKLRAYPDRLINPRTQQATLGLEREVAHGWVLTVDGVAQRTGRIDRPLDVNAPDPFFRTAPGQARSAAAADTTRPILPEPNGYRRVTAIVNDGTADYRALQTSVRRRFTRVFSATASYTWSHTINTVEPDIPSQDPSDAGIRGRAERATSLLDQRHRFVFSGWWYLGAGFSAGTVTSLASGRPFNVTTGTDNNGDGSTADRPVADNTVIARNSGQGTPVYDLQTFVQKEFHIGSHVRASVRAEAFNLLNHANIVGRSGTYGNDPAGLPAAGFGQALGGINNVDPGRMFQFQLRLGF